ncbi:hypothetical protein [Streptomyces sp. NPDC000405]|uniref:hypothetical protein n=1 Tax=Streptomyces sp. NPDC000405 TaxID=3161033 RepID=UPI00398CDE01
MNHQPSGLASNATRYLCVAVQLDGKLAKRAIESVLQEPRRAVASSPGVDLVCVLRYALAARSRRAVVQVLLVLIAFGLLASVIRPVVNLVSSTPSLPSPELVIPLLAGAWAVVLAERLVTFYGVLKPKLSRTAFDPVHAPRAQPQDEVLLSQLAAQDQQGNVSVFSGYEPFFGYGNLLGTWSFTVAVDRPGEGFDAVLPFTVKELTAAVTRAVESLGLPGVDISERVFVNGADLAQGLGPALRWLLLPDLKSRPRASLAPDAVEQLREDGSGRVRPYLVTTVSGWEGDLVTTNTVRFSLSPAKDLLFVEGGAWLLPPVHRRYHLVDHLLDRPTSRQLGILVKSSFNAVPARLVTSLFGVLAMPSAALTGSRKDREQLRQIDRNAFDYGAQFSLRQAVNDPYFQRYFQKIDQQMYTKVVEHRTMDALVDFLKDHDIDVSELRKRQSVIYNGGIFTSGNASTNFVNSAVTAGPGASIRALIGRDASE